MGELPADLVVNEFGSIGGRQAGGFDGIRGGARCVRAHVADGYGLTGGSGSRRGCRSFHLAARHPTDEAATNLLGSAQLSSGERASGGDGSARAIVCWSFGLKQLQDPLCATGSPCGDKASVGFAERLRRCHQPTLRSRSATPAISHRPPDRRCRESATWAP
jgi:hypothetical protein